VKSTDPSKDKERNLFSVDKSGVFIAKLSPGEYKLTGYSKISPTDKLQADNSYDKTFEVSPGSLTYIGFFAPSAHLRQDKRITQHSITTTQIYDDYEKITDFVRKKFKNLDRLKSISVYSDIETGFDAFAKDYTFSCNDQSSCTEIVTAVDYDQIPEVSIKPTKKNKALVYIYSKYSNMPLRIDHRNIGTLPADSYTYFYTEPDTTEITYYDRLLERSKLASISLDLEEGQVYHLQRIPGTASDGYGLIHAIGATLEIKNSPLEKFGQITEAKASKLRKHLDLSTLTMKF